jgi:hypothetical protein
MAIKMGFAKRIQRIARCEEVADVVGENSKGISLIHLADRGDRAGSNDRPAIHPVPVAGPPGPSRGPSLPAARSGRRSRPAALRRPARSGRFAGPTVGTRVRETFGRLSGRGRRGPGRLDRHDAHRPLPRETPLSTGTRRQRILPAPERLLPGRRCG